MNKDDLKAKDYPYYKEGKLSTCEKVLDECYKTFDGEQLKKFLFIYDKHFLKKVKKQEGE